MVSARYIHLRPISVISHDFLSAVLEMKKAELAWSTLESAHADALSSVHHLPPACCLYTTTYHVACF